LTEPDQKPHVPAPSLWPIGFAIGIATLLIGLVVSVAVLVVGAVLTVVFAFLWAADVFRGHGPAEAAPGLDEAAVAAGVPAAAAIPAAGEEQPEIPRYDRSGFLTASTVGIGAAIGGLIAVPVLGFTVLPSFVDQGFPDVDLGPVSNFKEGEFVVATFLEDKAKGEVSRRTAYVRNNGPTETGEPSFTVLFSRCVHLGCPVQPNGPLFDERKVTYEDVELIPTQPAGFGCPCHGGQYDTEGNRSAGPPVRALDRIRFSVVNGNLVLGAPFSVDSVEGAGAGARMKAYDFTYPGVHVAGPEAWLYPISSPSGQLGG
jgi:Rieske Fe-S protein